MSADDFGLPAPKRQRIANNEEPAARPEGSRLFTPFRNVGLVSPTSVPFTSVPLGKTTFQITTSVGRSLHTYDLRRGLQLVFLSRPQCPETITATFAYRDRVFVAWGGSGSEDQGVWVFKRGKLVAELEHTSTRQNLQNILVFGKWIVACGNTAIEVWKNDSYEHYTTIKPASSVTGDGPLTARLCTMPTYLNKIFVGCDNGNVEIYNISTGKLVHRLHPASSSGPVTALAPATALCVLAVAYADGSMCLYDVDTDEAVISISSNSNKAITSITFRSDGVGAGDDGRKDGVMATASIESGDIKLWDLNRGGKVTGVLRAAHETSNARSSGITGIEFLPGQPLIVSSGLDNAVRTWAFDATPFSPMPRPLHARSGHAAPVTELMFMPAASDGSETNGKWLLSAGQDRSLWGFSLRKDGQNTELSQGNVKTKAKKVGALSEDRSAVEDFKAGPIVDMACCLNRDGGMGAVSGALWQNDRKATAEESSMTGWESIVTAHTDDKFARTWSWGRKKAGRWKFESGDQRSVTSVAITACGTFALVGSAGGALDMFNLQSGVHRQRFPPRFKPAEAKELKTHPEAEQIVAARRGHSATITGIVVDTLNQTVISSSLDGSLIFWGFRTGLPVHRLHLPNASALIMQYSPSYSLLALACDDLCVRILDVVSRKTVRELWGCIGPINSLTFSNDGRWIVSASMDSVVRIFDLATGHLIDAFRTSPTCTNVAFNPTGEYLATTHSGTLGIQIWTNKSLYTNVSTRPISEETGIIDLTSVVSTFAPMPEVAAANAFDEAETNGLVSGTSIDQLSSSLLTLSLLPRSRWQTLLNLDTIRARNRPIAPPEKPKAAPFFLGSSLGLSNGDNSTDAKALTAAPKLSDLSRITSSALSSSKDTLDMDQLLTLPTDGTSSHPLMTKLLELPPSSTALTLQTLSMSSLSPFIQLLTDHLRHRRDYEVVNTYISLLLKYHSEFIQLDEVSAALKEFQMVNEEEGRRLGEMVGYTSGVVGGWLRSSR